MSKSRTEAVVLSIGKARGEGRKTLKSKLKMKRKQLKGAVEPGDDPEAQRLIEQASGLLGAFQVTARYQKRIELLRSEIHRDYLVIGVVGVTSSGKTALINALMGEQLLPQKPDPTTNLLVRCRRGPIRRVLIRFLDGRVECIEGAALSATAMEEFCYEEKNPRNAKGVDAIEWYSPTSVIAEDFVIVDTPGLEGYGMAHHEQVTLRQFLPIADIVLYAASVQRALQKSDLKLMNDLLENDQRVLFVLTKADGERDSEGPGGIIIETRERKVERQLERIRRDASKHGRLRNFGVLATCVPNGEAPIRSEDWERSGFPMLLNWIEQYRVDLKRFLAESRMLRVSSILKSGMGTLVHQISRLGKTSKENSISEDSKNRIRDLRSARREIRSALAECDAYWATRLARENCLARLRSHFKNKESESLLKEARSEVLKEWRSDQAELFESLNSLRLNVRKITQKKAKVDVTAQRAARLKMSELKFPRLEAFETSTVRQVARQRKRWYTYLGFGYETYYVNQTSTYTDKKKMLHAFKSFIGTEASKLSGFLAEEVSDLCRLYLAPVEAELREELLQVKEAEIHRIRTESEAKRAKKAVLAMEALSNKISQSVGSSLVRRGQESIYKPTALPATRTSRNPIERLINVRKATAFRENLFQFLTPLLTKASANEVKTIVLYGGFGSRLHNLDFLRLLAPSPSVSRKLGEVPNSDWIYVGPEGHAPSVPGVQTFGGLPGVCCNLAFVLPPENASDHALKHLTSLLETCDAIGIEVNASQIGSGLKSVMELNGQAILKKRKDAVFFLFGESQLITDYSQFVDVIPGYMADCSCGSRPWFLFSNYDVRYNDFVRIASQVVDVNGTPRELVRRWRQERLSIAAPFDETSLMRNFVNISVNRDEEAS